MRRILLVEDDPDLRSLGQLSLERIGGHEVVTAETGERALELADASFDVVLLDVRMPGIDGREVLRRLRANEVTAAVPAIFLTASVSDSDRDELSGVGAAGQIPKPFDPKELPNQIASLLGW